MKKALLLAAVIGIAASAQAAVTIPNGDFQAGAMTGWYSQDPPLAYSEVSSVVPDAGPSGAGDYAVHYAAWNYAYNALKQSGTVSLADYPIGTEFTASFDIKVNPQNHPLWGEVAGKIQVQPNAGNWYAYADIDILPIRDGAWHHITYNFTSLDSGNGTPYPVQFAVVTNAGGATGGDHMRDALFDNFQVSAVPEPGGLAILGLSAVGFLRRKRA